jgi:hypothetical protein
MFSKFDLCFDDNFYVEIALYEPNEDQSCCHDFNMTSPKDYHSLQAIIALAVVSSSSAVPTASAILEPPAVRPKAECTCSGISRGPSLILTVIAIFS